MTFKPTYQEFLESKIIQTPSFGFEVNKDSLHPILKPHQKDIVHWALEGGRRAIFASFGLGKSLMQLELARQVIAKTNKSFLIGVPLAVVDEFRADAALLGLTIEYVTCQKEIEMDYDRTENLIFVSNYERIRSGSFDPSYFGGVSFDEGDAIRNLETETSNYILNNFNTVKYRFIATATPSPNDYTEILNYAQYLGVMDRSQALTRFFQRDSTTAGNLTLYPHKVDEFWIWVRSWAVIIQKPSDLGHDDTGYDLPPMKIHYHEVRIRERGDIKDRDGNFKMFRDTSKGMIEASKEKRESITDRVEKAVELVTSDDSHWIMWHHLEDERRLIEKLVPEAKSVYGSQKWEERETNMLGFKQGEFRILSTKPEIAGAGCNFQKHCQKAVFVGIDYRFKDFIQAIHRIYRFLQTNEVEIHIIHSDAELDVLKALEAKWKAHREMVEHMSSIIKKYGLSDAQLVAEMKRTIGVNRKETVSDNWKAIHNDSVLEVGTMEENSIDMIMTSIPFSDQYEYCESYHDMGHNDGNDLFFEQMSYLTPELFRVLKPGRVACIHVKDRIRFSYQNGQGFTSIIDFSGKTVDHFEKYGWHLLGKHVIATDVVMENNQTYRLGWTEACKDMTKMGCGSPEYLLVFRKPPTDKSNAYADERVTKSKDDYTRGRWQLDANAFWRSSGNRLLTSDELKKLDLSQLGKWWKYYSQNNVYDYDTHVAICEELDKQGKLSATFATLPTKSLDDGIWDDVSRMHTLNTSQALKKKEKHVCPLQFDIIDRAITRYSNKGETVLDPFGGIMSVPYRCVLKLERKGIGIELNEQYWRDGVAYCKEAEYKSMVPTLFDAV
jgi:DNA modification methylase